MNNEELKMNKLNECGVWNVEGEVFNKAVTDNIFHSRFRYNSTLHPQHSKLKKAFTLAEVLITLGIIGVVAAMTMPVLIQNHRKHVVETRLQKFYSTINQAITMAEAEWGERTGWNWNNSTLTDYEWYNKYLNKYIKSIKVDNINNNAIVYFADGSLSELSRYGIGFYPEAKDYNYCQNLEDSKECSGKKMFNFFYNPGAGKQTLDSDLENNLGFSLTHYINNLVEPYKFEWDGTLDGNYGLRTSSNYGCKETMPANGRAYCTALIQQNGWKIPDDYPIRL